MFYLFVLLFPFFLWRQIKCLKSLLLTCEVGADSRVAATLLHQVRLRVGHLRLRDVQFLHFLLDRAATNQVRLPNHSPT